MILTQYHQVSINTDLYWPSTTKYQPVLPPTDPVPPSTNQYHLLLTQCHHISTSTASYWPSTTKYQPVPTYTVFAWGLQTPAQFTPGLVFLNCLLCQFHCFNYGPNSATRVTKFREKNWRGVSWDSFILEILSLSRPIFTAKIENMISPDYDLCYIPWAIEYYWKKMKILENFGFFWKISNYNFQSKRQKRPGVNCAGVCSPQAKTV